MRRTVGPETSVPNHNNTADNYPKEINYIFIQVSLGTKYTKKITGLCNYYFLSLNSSTVQAVLVVGTFIELPLI